MAGLFLNLYLWRLTEDLVINGIYNIINFAMTPIGFAFGAWIAKRTDRLVTYRIGILLTALFYLMVILAGTSVVDYYVLFAIFNGFALGMYWTAYLVLQYDVSNSANRLRFLALNTTFFNAAGLAGPAVAGAIIGMMEGLSGYIATFSLSLVLFVAAAVVSLRVSRSDSRHKPLYLRLTPLVMRRVPRWFKALLGFFVMGLYQGVMLFLPNILLFLTVGREDWVGYLGVLFSGLVIASGYVISRTAKEDLAKVYVLVSAAGVAVGASFLFVDFAFWTVAVFMVLHSLCNPLMLNTLQTYYFRMISELPLKGQLRNEAVVMREIFLNAGRVLSIVLLLAFAADLSSGLLPIVLLGTAGVQGVIFFLVGKPLHGKENG